MNSLSGFVTDLLRFVIDPAWLGFVTTNSRRRLILQMVEVCDRAIRYRAEDS